MSEATRPASADGSGNGAASSGGRGGNSRGDGREAPQWRRRLPGIAPDRRHDVKRSLVDRRAGCRGPRRAFSRSSMVARRPRRRRRWQSPCDRRGGRVATRSCVRPAGNRRRWPWRGLGRSCFDLVARRRCEAASVTRLSSAGPVATAGRSARGRWSRACRLGWAARRAEAVVASHSLARSRGARYPSSAQPELVADRVALPRLGLEARARTNSRL